MIFIRWRRARRSAGAGPFQRRAILRIWPAGSTIQLNIAAVRHGRVSRRRERSFLLPSAVGRLVDWAFSVPEASTHATRFFAETQRVAELMDCPAVEKMAEELAALRARNGRLFMIGVGGSAGNCSHAVNDFRKLCAIEAYAAVDNVSELTARTNDEGWSTVFSDWLKVSKLSQNDAIFVLSVGGGDATRNISANIVKAVDLAKERRATIFGVVGRSDGHTARVGDLVIVVPTVNPDRVTPLSESFQALVWHCLVSHPVLQSRKTTW
jgi:D-sedoheptulose 7-phosphate isomerase